MLDSSGTPGGERIVVLGKFTDALSVSVQGKTKDWVMELRSARKREISPDQFGEEASGLEVGDLPGGPLRLQPHGRGNYEYVLLNEACYLEITTATFANFPAMRIQLNSSVLYENGLAELEGIVNVIAGSFLEPGFKVLVSRFDLAIDFQLEGFELPKEEDVITRARYWKREGDGKGNTITFGKGSGALQVQLYNKTEKIKKSGKTWMFDVWQESPAYKEELVVWRVELRFFRRRLRSHSIYSVADLPVGMGNLVRSVLGDENTSPWIRFAAPETRGRNQDRREAAPWWEDLKAASLEGMPNTTSGLTYKLDAGPNLEHTESMLFAYLEKWQLQGGGEGFSPEETTEEEYLDLLGRRYSAHLAFKGLSRSEALNRRRRKMGVRSGL